MPVELSFKVEEVEIVPELPEEEDPLRTDAILSSDLNDEDMQTLKELALANDSVRVINGRQAITYRYVVPGMLLNDPVFTGLTEQNSTAG